MANTNNQPVEHVQVVPQTVFQPLNWELKGQIFPGKDGTGISVSIPGGRNFGGILSAAAEVAEVNGRQIAISGSYDAMGEATMKSFEDVVKTSYYAFLKNPAQSALQTVSFSGVTRKIRWAKENKSSEKAPIAAYFLQV